MICRLSTWAFCCTKLYASWSYFFLLHTQLLLPSYAAAQPGRTSTHSSSTGAVDTRQLFPAGDNQTDAMVTPRRDLKFGSTDSGGEAAPATVSAEASDPVTAPDSGKANAASASPPAFRRAVSFSDESHTLQPRKQAQGADGQYQAFDGSNLPDGITAIPVVDPDDPTVIVMQVSCRFLLHFASVCMAVTHLGSVGLSWPRWPLVMLTL